MEEDVINSSDRCQHCGHWAGDDEHPFVIYSKARSKWLEKAVKCVDGRCTRTELAKWIQEGKRLSRKGE